MVMKNTGSSVSTQLRISRSELATFASLRPDWPEPELRLAEAHAAANDLDAAKRSLMQQWKRGAHGTLMMVVSLLFILALLVMQAMGFQGGAYLGIARRGIFGYQYLACR